MNRWPRVFSFILFIVLCASLAYWAMQWFKPPQRTIAAPPAAALAPVKLESAAGLLGGRSSFAVASNFQLKGVVVSDDPQESVAILAVDGKPPQAVRMNAQVKPGITVKEVQRSFVLLSEGGVTKRVELPKDPKRK